MRRFGALLLFAATTAHGATIAEAVTAATQTPAFDKAVWFILIEDDDGRILADHNGNKLAIPASRVARPLERT